MPVLAVSKAVAKREGYKLDRYFNIEIIIFKFAHYKFVFFILIFTILTKERSGKMNFQIRQAITSNSGDCSTDFENTINDAIARGEEHLLPGLGVFLEAWWKNALQK